MPSAPIQPGDKMYFEDCKSRPIISFTHGKMDEPKRLLIVRGHSLHVQHPLELSTDVYQVSNLQGTVLDPVVELTVQGGDRWCTHGNTYSVRS